MAPSVKNNPTQDRPQVLWATGLPAKPATPQPPLSIDECLKLYVKEQRLSKMSLSGFSIALAGGGAYAWNWLEAPQGVTPTQTGNKVVISYGAFAAIASLVEMAKTHREFLLRCPYEISLVVPTMVSKQHPHTQTKFLDISKTAFEGAVSLAGQFTDALVATAIDDAKYMGTMADDLAKPILMGGVLAIGVVAVAYRAGMTKTLDFTPLQNAWAMVAR